MRRVAIATLFHDGLRSATLIVGLGAAWGLVTVQLGLRRGFELSSRAIVDHVGGDVWVGARGVTVIDDGEPLALSALGGEHACVLRRRPIIVDYGQARLQSGALVTVQIVGVDADSRAAVPWALAVGERRALDRLGSVAIDAADAEKLGLAGEGLGKVIELRSGASLHVAAVTRGARNFTQTPYLFVDVRTAREILSLPDDVATFWVHDLREQACVADVSAPLRARFAVASREELARSTSAHWIRGSGIGALLGAGSSMAALVGAAVLLQSTITLVRTHTRELATLRALGARRGEMLSFLAWQLGIVAALATALALLLATGLSEMLRASGLAVVVDVRSWLSGIGVAASSTAVASAIGARVLARIDPREILE